MKKPLTQVLQEVVESHSAHLGRQALQVPVATSAKPGAVSDVQAVAATQVSALAPTSLNLLAMHLLHLVAEEQVSQSTTQAVQVLTAVRRKFGKQTLQSVVGVVAGATGATRVQVLQLVFEQSRQEVSVALTGLRTFPSGQVWQTVAEVQV